MRKNILYPFMEESFCEQTLEFIEEISFLKKSRKIDAFIVVNQKGKTTQALRDNNLSFSEINLKRIVLKKDSYPVALFKLTTSTLGLFHFFRKQKIDVMHCADILPLLSWGNVAKMNKIPFITNVTESEKFSHYTKLIFSDTKRLVCLNEEIMNKIPSKFSYKSLLCPKNHDALENINSNAIKSYTVNFWIDLYDTLNQKTQLQDSIGLYK